MKGLTLKTQYNIDDARIENSRFWSPNHGDGVNNGGYAFNAAVHSSIWTWTNTATYDFTANRHHFNFLVGMEATESSYNEWGGRNSGAFCVPQWPTMHNNTKLQRQKYNIHKM